MTDLLQAIFNCDLRKVKNFVSGGQNVNCKIPGTDGCTILHIIAGTKNSTDKDDIISYLLDMGADPNSRSDDDLTPVHIAAMWNNKFELEKLLQKGGNPWLVDNEEKNAFDLAADNYAYEAYQLLNQYHAENKLDFRIRNLTSKIKSIYLTDSQQMGYSNCSSETVNTAFCTANEHFPLDFSSGDDESKSFLKDVSKIVKKYNYTSEQGENETFTDNLTNHSWSYKNQNVHNKAIIFSSSETFHKENNLSNGTNNSSETIIESDDVSGIALVQMNSSSNPFSLSNEKCANYSSLTVNDWKSYSCLVFSSSSDCSSFSNSEILVPEKYSKLSNSKLFQELVYLGDKPGPINDFTREVYLKRLTRLKSGCQISCSLPKPKFCPEIYRFLSNKLNVSKIQEYIDIMTEEFNNSRLKTKWREGSKKCCFNYFLLDPRVTQNLPARQVSLKFEQKFQIFVDAIFYVGKGTKGRPYSHLLEAVKAMVGLHIKTDKILHILDIWNSGYGVISLHCFHNCIPVEAYTQEACIIEALGLKNLTNVRVGGYYGQAVKWSRSRKRQVGISLLNRALQIFLHEGEKQIKPKDLKTK